jgi:hypothetical protein
MHHKTLDVGLFRKLERRNRVHELSTVVDSGGTDCLLSLSLLVLKNRQGRLVQVFGWLVSDCSQTQVKLEAQKLELKDAQIEA